MGLNDDLLEWKKTYGQDLSEEAIIDLIIIGSRYEVLMDRIRHNLTDYNGLKL
jgi:hypothetical protein